MTPMDDEKDRSGSDAKERGAREHARMREAHLDKTIEDSFPASDPPSTDPNPDGDE